MNKHNNAHWYLKNTNLNLWASIKAFGDDECDRIIDYCEKQLSKTKGEVYNADISDTAIVNSKIRSCSVGFLNSTEQDTRWLFEKCSLIVNEVNSKVWNFDLDYIETLQYTIYDTLGDEYKTHMDILGPNPNYRKLSFSIQLDDPRNYQGADLIINPTNDPISATRERGTVTFFPSFVTHEVTPLIFGQRRSLVGWICGPAFR